MEKVTYGNNSFRHRNGRDDVVGNHYYPKHNRSWWNSLRLLNQCWQLNILATNIYRVLVYSLIFVCLLCETFDEDLISSEGTVPMKSSNSSSNDKELKNAQPIQYGRIHQYHVSRLSANYHGSFHAHHLHCWIRTEVSWRKCSKMEPRIILFKSYFTCILHRLYVLPVYTKICEGVNVLSKIEIGNIFTHEH